MIYPRFGKKERIAYAKKMKEREWQNSKKDEQIVSKESEAFRERIAEFRRRMGLDEPSKT